MKYLKLFEEYNVQDIMSIPTPISYWNRFNPLPYNIPDVKIEGGEISNEIMQKLTPIHNYLSRVPFIEISMINYGDDDKESVGFAFKIGNDVYQVLTNTKTNELFLIDPEGNYNTIKNVEDVLNFLDE